MARWFNQAINALVIKATLVAKSIKALNGTCKQGKHCQRPEALQNDEMYVVFVLCSSGLFKALTGCIVGSVSSERFCDK